MKLTDQSQMPFGKYAGHVMEKVPASYLLYLWDETELWNRGALLSKRQDGYSEKRLALHDYIRENFTALETECEDRIVTHKP
jgi:hypothetical protein